MAEKFATGIRIPHDENPLEIVACPLEDASYVTTHEEISWDFEDHLGFVPDLSKYSDWQDHTWRHRSLIDLGDMNPFQTHEESLRSRPLDSRGPWFMYKCTTERADRPRNHHFKAVQGAPAIYGSVFIFKVTKPMVKSGGEAEYDTLDEASIKNAFRGKGISDGESLKWLAAQEPEGEIEPEEKVEPEGEIECEGEMEE